MKRAFKLDGLDCAHCASKIETQVAALTGVTSVTVNFMTTKMVIEGDDASFDSIVEQAQKIVKKLEPDVVVRKA